MRRLFLTGLGLVLILYLMPVFFTSESDIYDLLPLHSSSDPTTTAGDDKNISRDTNADTDASDSDFVTAASNGDESSSVVVSIEGKPTELPLETYVEGVVAAEAPDNFPIEALRAQAVAARTYAIYKMSKGRPDEHPDADLCDDYTHCAAYRDPAVAASSGDGISNIQQAVRDTANEILTYEGTPIAAMFHSASGPRTESACDVWGETVPYLQSVVSPGGSACDEYEGTVTVSADDFRKTVTEAFPDADVSGPPDSWFSSSSRSAGGAVKTVQLGGVEVSGVELRELFELNSTNFTITTREDSISFHTIGCGHCVGLSQYGARYMAEQGASYEEILEHYYTGTVIESYAG